MADETQVDGYYGDDNLDDSEIDLSFLDEKDDEDKENK
jgi:hypothetical protein